MSHQKVERFQEGIDLVKKMGVDIRYAYLNGNGGGLCQIKDQKCLYIDLALDMDEQMVQLEQAIQLALEEKNV